MSRLLSVDAAARAIRDGRLVIVPTETVYGLAASALNPDAVARIFEAKGRPQFNPIICHLPDAEAVFRLGKDSPTARGLCRFWPGPLTVLLPHEGRIPGIVTAGSPLAGFRVPDHPLMLELLQSCALPLAAPSANRSGRRSPTSADMALADWFENGPDEVFADAIAGALDGGPCAVGIESTVVTIVDEERGVLRILRPGGVAREDLLAQGLTVLEETASEPAPLPPRRDEHSDPDAVRVTTSPLLHAPGQLLKHYAPGLPLLVLRRHGHPDTGGAPDAPRGDAATEAVRIQAALNRLVPTGMPVWWLSFGGRPAPVPCDGTFDLSPGGDLREAARNLFACFDRVRAQGPAVLLAETLPERGLGVAINDRLTRAASELISFA